MEMPVPTEMRVEEPEGLRQVGAVAEAAVEVVAEGNRSVERGHLAIVGANGMPVFLLWDDRTCLNTRLRAEGPHRRAEVVERLLLCTDEEVSHMPTEHTCVAVYSADIERRLQAWPSEVVEAQVVAHIFHVDPDHRNEPSFHVLSMAELILVAFCRDTHPSPSILLEVGPYHGHSNGSRLWLHRHRRCRIP